MSLIPGASRVDNPAVKNRLYALAAVAVLVLLGPLLTVAEAQCSMCGTVGLGADDPLVRGMFQSIVFLVSMPFVLLATVGGWLFLQIRDAAVPEKPETRLIPFRRDGRE